MKAHVYKVPNDASDSSIEFSDSAIVEGIPLTQETRIIAALVLKLGGQITLDLHEYSAVKGLIMSNNSLGDIVLDAE